MIYKVTKLENGGSIISELNANVLTATFTKKVGLQKADLYKDGHGADAIVAFGTCAPSGSTFAGTITINFGKPVTKGRINNIISAVLLSPNNSAGRAGLWKRLICLRAELPTIVNLKNI